MNKAQALPEETCSLVKKADMYQTVSLPALDSDGEMHRALPAHRGGAPSHLTWEGRAGFLQETFPVLEKVSQLVLHARRQSEQRHGDKKQGRVSTHPKKMRVRGLS